MESVHDQVNTLFERYRLVDLSAVVRPGVMAPDGKYTWGQERRRFELRRWISPGGHYQSFVDAGSHVGTHVDLPSHIVEGARAPDGKALASSDLPLRSFCGEALVLGFPDLPVTDARRPVILPEHVREAKPGDIVLLWSPHVGSRTPTISLEAAKRLAELPIKLIGVQNVSIDYDSHVAFLGKRDGPIPIIEEMEHLDELRARRVLFFGLPMRVAELEASWIRAIAFEPNEPT